MKLYNTLSRQVEEFAPIKPPRVGIYICGPTVYDFAHLGHSRTYINSDVLVRALKWLDWEPYVVMNITDVGHLTSQADTGEDKLEKQAKKEAKPILEIAKFYTEDFFKMREQLNILMPDKITPATQYIPEMIELVKILEQKGLTYKTSDGVYFNTSKFKDYGQLARLDLAGMKEGWRVDKNPEKKHPADFALWKFADPEEHRQLEWDSPWGKHSFPGWHIECSAMSLKYLGPTLDIHTGGVDHIAIHHTNEIAQSEAATGKPFVKYWFHSNFLDVSGEKMSKSLGNYIRTDDLIKKGYDPLALRYLFLTGHYRTKMNFTYAALDAAVEAYTKLKSMVADWQGKRQRTQLSPEKLDKLQGLSLQFKTAVEADLNLPQALAAVWQMAKSNIPEQDKWELINDWDLVLGLGLGQISSPKSQIPNNIKILINQRENLRKNKQWAEADKLRRQIVDKGYKIEDKHA
ncbi:cysteine--tRNA ligase [Candidatus Beckwithbacteria bacterium CG_4_10_14_0_2_um_filter_47_25]|uniref:Cysteine--tRNA ligase n=3 Tax=Candidatus Beckwithiibacteriota TaxID=1752726 RepID=A0A1J4RPE9_9BACT|nr:MAG: cysteine--tRNA ligase [Candidatus Beckwithbacteria bacterium CG1_02_47_37]PIP52465.1 MAG: cysteine--tRNA ligase [Candidatus Beckwithbacteria bacterium CG23_combo_of_CG06-09_8_20_14_all_47_9]PJA23405.1 MAG: cysteine--tRNA ligase [Candidatus Beckwithbacteria bacterium CG_4_10_14_0_2_um_filter_47_25]